MSRTLRVLVMIVLLASCGGGNYSAPRNLDNACSILAQRPKYARAFRATERRWGVPVDVAMPHTGATALIEFGSSLDEHACDESFGVDDVQLHVR